MADLNSVLQEFEGIGPEIVKQNSEKSNSITPTNILQVAVSVQESRII